MIVIALLYIAAATFAWQIKEWVETPVTVAIFLALGAAATIGGVLRGHLVFTALMNRGRLAAERHVPAAPTRLLDLLTACCCLPTRRSLPATGALPAVFALALGLGIALASLVLEPATTAAAFGEDA